MKTTFYHLMLFVALSATAIGSAAQAGTLSACLAESPLAESSLSLIAVGEAMSASEMAAASGVKLADPARWAEDLLESSLAETSRLHVPAVNQPLADNSVLSDLQQIQAEGASAIGSVTPNALANISGFVTGLTWATRAAGGGLEEVRSLIATMGNGMVADTDHASVAILHEEATRSARSEDDADWSADDPTSEYLDFNYRTVDFKQFFDTNSNTVAVKVDINKLVESATPTGMDLDNVIDGFFNPEDQASDTLAASFDASNPGSLDNFAATPEPSSMLMMCFGMLFFGLNNRRQRRRARGFGMTESSLTG